MMVKDLIDRVLASFKEDCDNITNLYGEEYSCGFANIVKYVKQYIN